MNNRWASRFLFPVLLCVISSGSSAKGDYKQYYALINRAEAEFVKYHDERCFPYYDSAFRLFAPFVKDPYIAAEIAYYLKDTTAMMHYLDIGFKNGLPLTSVSSAPLLRHIDQNSLYPAICKLYDKDKDVKKINVAAQNKIWLFCYESDSLKLKMNRDPLVRQQWFSKENTFREYIFREYLSKGVFPGERIIGIATDSMYAANLACLHKQDLYAGFGFGPADAYKQDYDLSSKYALPVLLHSRCSFPKYHDRLWQAVLNGYLQPKEYAILEVTSTLWNQHNENTWDDCHNERRDLYYYILPEEEHRAGLSEDVISIIEQNRQHINMQAYKVDIAKKQLQQETGIWFFYDFIDRPRN